MNGDVSNAMGNEDDHSDVSFKSNRCEAACSAAGPGGGGRGGGDTKRGRGCIHLTVI